jgi:hypothetical protein
MARPFSLFDLWVRWPGPCPSGVFIASASRSHGSLITFFPGKQDLLRQLQEEQHQGKRRLTSNNFERYFCGGWSRYARRWFMWWRAEFTPFKGSQKGPCRTPQPFAARKMGWKALLTDTPHRQSVTDLGLWPVPGSVAINTAVDLSSLIILINVRHTSQWQGRHLAEHPFTSLGSFIRALPRNSTALPAQALLRK